MVDLDAYVGGFGDVDCPFDVVFAADSLVEGFTADRARISLELRNGFTVFIPDTNPVDRGFTDPVNGFHVTAWCILDGFY